jgi:hypothetical protein
MDSPDGLFPSLFSTVIPLASNRSETSGQTSGIFSRNQYLDTDRKEGGATDERSEEMVHSFVDILFYYDHSI